ncbi:mitochondrial peripheral inner membrane protein, partial [Perkinsus olseni]
LMAEVSSLRALLDERGKALHSMETRVQRSTLDSSINHKTWPLNLRRSMRMGNTVGSLVVSVLYVAAREVIRHDETTLERRARELEEECNSLRQICDVDKEARASAEEKLTVVEQEMNKIHKECERLRGDADQLPLVIGKLSECKKALERTTAEKAEQTSRADREQSNKEEAEKELRKLKDEMDELLIKMRVDVECVQVETFKRELAEARVLMTRHQAEAAKSRDEVEEKGGSWSGRSSQQVCRLRAELDLMKTSQLDRVVQENDRLKRRSAEMQQLLDTAHEEALQFRKGAGDAESLRKEKARLAEELDRLKREYYDEKQRHAKEVASFTSTVETQREKLNRLEGLHREIERIDLHSGLSALQSLARTVSGVRESSGGEAAQHPGTDEGPASVHKAARPSEATSLDTPPITQRSSIAEISMRATEASFHSVASDVEPSPSQEDREGPAPHRIMSGTQRQLHDILATECLVSTVPCSGCGCKVAHLREHPLFDDVGTCVRCLDYLDPDTTLAGKAAQDTARERISTGWERDDDDKEVGCQEGSCLQRTKAGPPTR